MKSISEVQTFLEEAFKKEYELLLESFSNENRNNYIDKVYDFFDEYMIFSGELAFNSMTAWMFDHTEEEKKNLMENILRLRKIFVIECSDGAKYDNAIANVATSDLLFTCYASDNHQIGLHRYTTRYFVSPVEEKLKIIAHEQRTSNDQWKDFRQFKSILDYGKRADIKKILPPEDEKDLDHFKRM